MHFFVCLFKVYYFYGYLFKTIFSNKKIKEYWKLMYRIDVVCSNNITFWLSPMSDYEGLEVTSVWAWNPWRRKSETCILTSSHSLPFFRWRAWRQLTSKGSGKSLPQATDYREKLSCAKFTVSETDMRVQSFVRLTQCGAFVARNLRSNSVTRTEGMISSVRDPTSNGALLQYWTCFRPSFSIPNLLTAFPSASLKKRSATLIPNDQSSPGLWGGADAAWTSGRRTPLFRYGLDFRNE